MVKVSVEMRGEVLWKFLSSMNGTVPSMDARIHPPVECMTASTAVRRFTMDGRIHRHPGMPESVHPWNATFYTDTISAPVEYEDYTDAIRLP